MHIGSPLANDYPDLDAPLVAMRPLPDPNGDAAPGAEVLLIKASFSSKFLPNIVIHSGCNIFQQLYNRSGTEGLEVKCKHNDKAVKKFLQLKGCAPPQRHSCVTICVSNSFNTHNTGVLFATWGKTEREFIICVSLPRKVAINRSSTRSSCLQNVERGDSMEKGGNVIHFAGAQ
jgi:hypothetical protein